MTRLREIKEARGLRSVDIAKGASIHPATLSKLERAQRKLGAEFASKIAGLLGVDASELYKPIGSPIPPAPLMITSISRDTSQVDVPMLPSPESMRLNVPIYRTVEYRNPMEADFSLDTAPTNDSVARPPGLLGQPAHAVYMQGDAMDPWRQRGELVYYHELRPPAVGCHVLILLRKAVEDHPGARVALVRKWVGRTDDELELEQYNPRRRSIIPVSDIEVMYRVFEWQEALGLG